MAQIPKGRLAKGQDKPICRDCAMCFSSTVFFHFEKSTFDGSEIRRSPVDVVNMPLFAGGFFLSFFSGKMLLEITNWKGSMASHSHESWFIMAPYILPHFGSGDRHLLSPPCIYCGEIGLLYGKGLKFQVSRCFPPSCSWVAVWKILMATIWKIVKDSHVK